MAGREADRHVLEFVLRVTAPDSPLGASLAAMTSDNVNWKLLDSDRNDIPNPELIIEPKASSQGSGSRKRKSSKLSQALEPKGYNKKDGKCQMDVWKGFTFRKRT